MSEIISPLSKLKFLPDDDNIRVKQIIKSRLIENKPLLHALHNTSLSEDSPDDYIGTSIRFSKNIPETQSEPAHFVLVYTETDAVPQYNSYVKYFQVQFVVLADSRDLIDKETGIERHDLIAAILRNEFGYSNAFGTTLTLVRDRELASDINYAMRELTYQATLPKDIARTDSSGRTRAITTRMKTDNV